MNFCEKCDNMYYMKIGENDALSYYCRNCGHEQSDLKVSNLRVSLYEKVSTTKTTINAYIKFDPTLPHSNTIKCPNADCTTNKKDQPSDVIYFRYDDIQMKYMYLCAICDYNWKP